MTVSDSKPAEKLRPMTAADKPLFYPLRYLETENAVRRVLGWPEVRDVDGQPYLVDR